MFQAFIDDSYDLASGTFVLGGHIATAERWAEFTKIWGELLPLGTLNKYNKYHFKMAEMAALPERLERVPAFYRAIENGVLLSLSCRVNINQVKRAKARIYVPGVVVDWGFMNNPFLIAFRSLIDLFHGNRDVIDRFIPNDATVDFIFDNQTERKIVHKIWEEYLERRDPEVRRYFGQEPRFEDDTRFVALQAADFWAWWLRKWTDDGVIEERLADLDFGGWRKSRDWPRIDMSVSENDIVKFIKSELPSIVGPAALIHDLGPSVFE